MISFPSNLNHIVCDPLVCCGVEPRYYKRAANDNYNDRMGNGCVVTHSSLTNWNMSTSYFLHDRTFLYSVACISYRMDNGVYEHTNILLSVIYLICIILSQSSGIWCPHAHFRTELHEIASVRQARRYRPRPTCTFSTVD
jgi:hypothetical protein